MHCIQNTYIGTPTLFNKTVAGITCILAITTIALSIISLTGTSLGPINTIVQLGVTTNGILLGTSTFVLILDLFWIAAICKKKRKTFSYENEIIPDSKPNKTILDNKTVESKILHKKEKPSLDEQANGKALHQLMTPKAQELSPLVFKQVSYTATWANNHKCNLDVLEYDWISTLGGWQFINLTMPRNFFCSFSQLDISPFICLNYLTLENCNGELPKGIEKRRLEELHLKNAELESLPDYFCQLSLKVLQLDGCIMDRIPDVIFKLSSLENLQINNLKNRHESNVPIKLILDEETCNKLKALPNLKVLKIVNSGWQDGDLDDLKRKLSPIDIVLHYTPLELELQK